MSFAEEFDRFIVVGATTGTQRRSIASTSNRIGGELGRDLSGLGYGLELSFFVLAMFRRRSSRFLNTLWVISILYWSPPPLDSRHMLNIQSVVIPWNVPLACFTRRILQSSPNRKWAGAVSSLTDGALDAQEKCD